MTNPFFNIWRVTRGEMCVQEAFRLFKMCLCIKDIGVGAGGARGAAALPNFGQLRFFGQREKIWAKAVFKDVSILFNYFKDLNINLKSA